VFLDFDDIALPLFLEPDDDPELITGYLARLLPRAFWTCSYFWQWSCGQGFDGGKTLRCHLWFWSREKRTEYEMENWALTLNGETGKRTIDHTVFRAFSPIISARRLSTRTCPTRSRPAEVDHLEAAEWLVVAHAA
jgi:hypothetical protein